MEPCLLSYRSGTILSILAKKNRILLSNVSFSLKEGESLALIGESGSGKSLLASSLIGALPLNLEQIDGELIYRGMKLTKKTIRPLLGKEIVTLPQGGTIALNPSRTVKSLFMDYGKRLKMNKEGRLVKMEETLKRVGFALPYEIYGKYPLELSGGMAQRVLLALSLLSNPSLLILDEPTNGVDEKHKETLVKTIFSLFPKAMKIIVTHDIELAKQTDYLLVLMEGKVLEKGRSVDVLGNPLHPYTKSLLSSLPRNGLKECPRIREQIGDCPFYHHCLKAGKECLVGPIRTKEYQSHFWRCQK